MSIYETRHSYMNETRLYVCVWGVETQKNVRGEIEGWGRVPFNEPYAPSLNTIYDGALIKFFENGTRPQPPTSRLIHDRHASRTVT